MHVRRDCLVCSTINTNLSFLCVNVTHAPEVLNMAHRIAFLCLLNCPRWLHFNLAIQEGVGLDITHICARQMGFFSILHYGRVTRDGYEGDRPLQKNLCVSPSEILTSYSVLAS